MKNRLKTKGPSVVRAAAERLWHGRCLRLAAMGLALVLGGCEESPQNVETNASARAELVFIGDHIVTMAGDSPSAVAVNGERLSLIHI